MNSKFNLIKKPEKKDDFDIEEEDEEEEIEYDEEDNPLPKKSSNDDDAKKRMFKFMGIIFGAMVLLLIILFIASLFNKKSYTYPELEKILKDAAVSYFKSHKDQLPQDDGDVVEIDSSNLVAAGKMQDLSQYKVDGNTCTGSVQVEKVGSEYVYTPYLNCGDSYTSIELATKIKNDNSVVSSGYGLYQVNSAYVFRGEDVNNYVQLDNSLWRVVKIQSDNSVLLVNEEGIPYTQPWDDRYNAERMYESGLNQYSVSRIKEYLNKVYTTPSEDDGEKILSNRDKSLLTSNTLCVYKRTIESEGYDNSIECRDVLEGQKLGLLTVSDYMMASIDNTCKTPSNKACLNYNYLVKNFEWWLLTANAEDNSTVFAVDRNGYISKYNASNYAIVRPTIVLGSKAMFKSGEGTLEKPYTVK